MICDTCNFKLCQKKNWLHKTSEDEVQAVIYTSSLLSEYLAFDSHNDDCYL